MHVLAGIEPGGSGGDCSCHLWTVSLPAAGEVQAPTLVPLRTARLPLSEHQGGGADDETDPSISLDCGLEGERLHVFTSTRGVAFACAVPLAGLSTAGSPRELVLEAVALAPTLLAQ